MKRAGFVFHTALVVVPLGMAGLWYASERETLTKSIKNEKVEVYNDLFGDTDVEWHPVPGPILGYYIGLDAVIGSILACGAAAGVSFWRRRRRAKASRRKSES